MPKSQLLTIPDLQIGVIQHLSTQRSQANVNDLLLLIHRFSLPQIQPLDDGIDGLPLRTPSAHMALRLPVPMHPKSPPQSTSPTLSDGSSTSLAPPSPSSSPQYSLSKTHNIKQDIVKQEVVKQVDLPMSLRNKLCSYTALSSLVTVSLSGVQFLSYTAPLPTLMS